MRKSIAVLLVLVFSLAVVSCSSPQAAELQSQAQVADQLAKTAHAAATQAVAEAQAASSAKAPDADQLKQAATTAKAQDAAAQAIAKAADALAQAAAKTASIANATDTAAKTVQQITSDPAVQTGAGVIPYGGLILGVLGLAAATWLKMRNGQLSQAVDHQSSALNELASHPTTSAAIASASAPSALTDATTNALKTATLP